MRRIALIVLPILAVAALVVLGAFIVFGDDGDGVSSPELEDGLPVVPATVAPELGTKRGEPLEDTALVIPSPPPTPDATWDGLTETAQAEGSVPVIVTLKANVQPEGLLSPSNLVDQRRQISSLGDGVLRLVSGDATDVEQFASVPVLTMEATPAALEDLRGSPAVASVIEDVPVAIPPWPAASADPPAATQLADWWDIEHIGLNTSWEKGYDGRGWAVAVLDTGVQRDHPGLTGKVVNETCFSAGRSCPNGTTQQFGRGAAAPCTYVPGTCAHGTHVAHTAAGKYGVANQAKILAVQVFSRLGAAECARHGVPNVQVCALSYTSDQLRGLEHIYNVRNSYRIAAINVSIGGGRHVNYCDAASGFAAWANTLRSVGIATVVSSGNSGYGDAMGSPACSSTVVSVGATTIASGSDAVANFSNSAPMLNLLAPGVHICSAVPRSRWECQGWQGTSMAAPHVAGAFAVLRQLQPTVSVSAAQNMLSASGTGVTDPRNGLTRTRIHVWNALVALYNS